MSFFQQPSSIPQVTFPPYTPHPRHSVGTLHYEKDYNHDLTAIKVQLRNFLTRNNLSEMWAGFPFQCMQDIYGREPATVSYASYDFQFHEAFHSLEQRSGLRSVTFQYSSPSPRPGSHMMDWTIVVPERQSLRQAHCTPGIVSIAHVQVNPLVRETSFGFALMTNPHIVQRALALSIELGMLITIQVANRKTPVCSPGQILFLTTDSHGRSQVVSTFTG
ncbi:hypothetical protein HYPSUDRAFT_42092 [Hypholoma sublateritium FD-334 SS-4]|uniref:Uncharacterized protein n=1 Tax=Hypholoma sublateritium (strain FD-334 SS-4) TaxID=945553 RepID=A0A0D2PNG3_HYPSF|nr:hypothetical protein HYPSUDRAFT_42092 [Hypholoma sublateritium FD-334 SS-4]